MWKSWLTLLLRLLLLLVLVPLFANSQQTLNTKITETANNNSLSTGVNAESWKP